MSIPVSAEGIGAIGIIAAWLVRETIPRIQRKRNGNNNNSKPGKADVCIERGEILAKHIVTLGHIDKALDENRDDHKLMFKKLDEMK